MRNELSLGTSIIIVPYSKIVDLYTRIQFTPFLRIFILFVSGILLEPWIQLPTWALGLCLGVTYTMAWISKKETIIGWCYVSCAILLTGLILARIHTPDVTIPRDTPVLVSAEITETPVISGRWARTTGEVGFYRSAYDSTRKWIPAHERVILYIDTSHHIALGDQAAFRTYLNPIGTENGYTRLMRARGYTATAFVPRGRLLATAPNAGLTPLMLARRMQQTAVQRLSRLHLTSDQANIAIAMATGEKRSIGKELKTDYSITGTSHVLAVSGLHTGIVFLLINLLLWPLSMIRRGHVIRNVIAILALWTYAMMSGLSPSVIRAALMCSALQIALAVTTRNYAYNTLFGAAVVMLALNPGYLYDISFQLSFLAVLSILFCYKRFMRLVHTRYKTVNYLVGLVLIGLAAQIGTLPLIAAQFGNIPLVSLWINPPVVLCATVIVLLSVTWILIPLPILAPIFHTLIASAVDIQNSIVHWGASLPVAAIRGIELSPVATGAIYLFLLILALLVKTGEKPTPFTLSQ